MNAESRGGQTQETRHPLGIAVISCYALSLVEERSRMTVPEKRLIRVPSPLESIVAVFVYSQIFDYIDGFGLAFVVFGGI